MSRDETQKQAFILDLKGGKFLIQALYSKVFCAGVKHSFLFWGIYA